MNMKSSTHLEWCRQYFFGFIISYYMMWSMIYTHFDRVLYTRNTGVAVSQNKHLFISSALFHIPSILILFLLNSLLSQQYLIYRFVCMIQMRHSGLTCILLWQTQSCFVPCTLKQWKWTSYFVGYVRLLYTQYLWNHNSQFMCVLFAFALLINSMCMSWACSTPRHTETIHRYRYFPFPIAMKFIIV